MSKKQEKPIQNNLVAKHMHLCNKSSTFANKKQNAKRGYQKHKGKSFD